MAVNAQPDLAILGSCRKRIMEGEIIAAQNRLDQFIIGEAIVNLDIPAGMAFDNTICSDVIWRTVEINQRP